MTALPENYLSRMQAQLGTAYPAFLASYEQPPVRGLRFSRKARPETIAKLKEAWNLKPVFWCPQGFRYTDARPGLSVYHDAGVFYIQEPSAMSVAEAAGLESSDLVLDLCAAPGGKSTAAAEKCAALLSNEIIPSRARILSSNVERMGLSNVLVSSAEPARLRALFEECFDAVITDAPCSGEGMMRKDETAVREWSPENVELCIRRQEEILEEACAMVRPGGKLIYSTCTFEPGENALQISAFLARHPEFSRITEEQLWPHLIEGEGHYCAVLRKAGEKPAPGGTAPEKLLRQLEQRLSSAGVHILRTGLLRGETRMDRKGKTWYEPSHAEIMASGFAGCAAGVNLTREEDALGYLRGNALRVEESTSEFRGEEGFCGVYFDGYPLGVGKRSGFLIKNHLPKGLRRL